VLKQPVLICLATLIASATGVCAKQQPSDQLPAAPAVDAPAPAHAAALPTGK